MQIDRIFTEYQEQPLGLEERSPRFSWTVRSERKDAQQRAYQIRVWSETDAGMVWDSGKRESSQAAGIVYEGEALAACTRYDLELQIWDEKGNRIVQKSWFETGLMNPDRSCFWSWR